MMEIFITVVAMFLMPVLYRMHGGMKPKLPWKLDEILIAGLITGVLSLYVENPYLLVASFLGAAIFKLKGHGQWMTLKFNERFVKKIEAEDLDIFVRPFFGKDPRTTVSKYTNKKGIVSAVERYGSEKLYNRCLFGLFISGMSVMLLPSIITAVAVSVPVGIGLALVSGLGKTLGYMLGWWVFPEGTHEKAPFKELNEATEIGEFTAGVGVALALSLTLFL